MKRKIGIISLVCLLIITILVFMKMNLSNNRKFVMDTQYPMELTHLLPEGFENMEFNEYLGLGGGYLFKKIDDEQILYYVPEDDYWVSETLAYGGVVIYRDLLKEFSDGKLTFVAEPYNHFSVIEEESLDGLDAPALLWKVSVDLYTHAELEKLEDSRQTQFYLWYVVFSEEESNITYALVLNAEYFDKNDILTIAKSVKFSDSAFQSKE